MAMFFLRMAQPRETSGGTCMYMGMSQPTLMYVDATYRYELGLKKKTVLDLLDAPDQHRSVPPRAMCCCKLCSPKVVVLKLQGWETSHERSNI